MLGALSVLVGWNVNFADQFERLGLAIGLAEGSVGQDVLVGVGVPGGVLALTVGAVTLYEKVVWPRWPSSGCCRGLWLYGLVAHADEEDFLICGWFRVHHTPSEIRIDEAIAYYVENDDLIFRGKWASDTVWPADRRIAFVFAMAAEGVTREPLPSRYQGFLELGARTVDAHNKQNVWAGYFHDLGDRRGVHGPVAGRHLGNRHKNMAEEDILTSHLPVLRRTLAQLGGGAAVLSPKPAPAPPPPAV